MKTIQSIVVFITLMLAACTPQAAPTTIPSSSPSPVPPSATPSPTVTPTVTPTATITPTAMPTPMGNSGKLMYSSCGLRNTHCTGIYSIDLSDAHLDKIADTGVVYDVSPDGQRIFAVQDDKVSYVEDLNTSTKYPIPKAGNQFQWFPDGQHIAYIAYSGNVRIPNVLHMSKWDGSEDRELTSEKDNPFTLIGISTVGNETKIYYGAADPLHLGRPLGIFSVDVDTGIQKQIMKEGKSIDCSSSGNRMACWGGNWYANMIDLETLNSVDLIYQEDLTKDPPGQIGQYMLWSPDGKKLIVSSWTYQPSYASNIYIFSASDGKLLKQSPRIEGKALVLSDMSPDGKLALLTDHGSEVTLYILNLDDFSLQELKPDIPSEKDAFLKLAQWVPLAIP